MRRKDTEHSKKIAARALCFFCGAGATKPFQIIDFISFDSFWLKLQPKLSARDLLSRYGMEMNCTRLILAEENNHECLEQIA